MLITRIISGWFLIFILLISACIINSLQLLSNITLSLVLPSLKFRINQKLANAWWDLLVFTIEIWNGVEIVFYGDNLPRNSNCIMIGNHSRAALDFIVGVIVTHYSGLGCGKMVTMMKNVLKYVPIIGFTNYFQGSLFLKRKLEKDLPNIEKILGRLNGGTIAKPYWFGLYPEGTRVTPKKLASSQKYAKENSLPHYEHVMLPKTSGFSIITHNLRTSLDYLCDCTIKYTGKTMNGCEPKLGDALTKGRFKTQKIHICTKAIPKDQIPSKKEDLRGFLYNVWTEKDKKMEYFQKNGRFEQKRVYYKSKISYLFGLFTAWSIISLVALCYLFGCTSLGFIGGFVALYILTIGVSSTALQQKLAKGLAEEKNIKVE